MGIFDAFVADSDVRLIGVEAGGHGIAPGKHAARFAGGSSGVLQGTRSYVLQDARRQHRADPFDLGRPRLRRGRTRARLAARLRPRRVRVDWRRRRARRVPAAGPRRRHPAGARVVARDRLRLPASRRRCRATRAAGEPLGTRRQGRPQRAEGRSTPEGAADHRAPIRGSRRAASTRCASRPAAAAWSPTSRPAIRTRTRSAEILDARRPRRRGRHRSWRARSPIRSPMAR